MARDTGERRTGFLSHSLRKNLTEILHLEVSKASRLKRFLAQPGIYNFPISFPFFRYSYAFSAQWRYFSFFFFHNYSNNSSSCSFELLQFCCFLNLFVCVAKPPVASM